MKPGITLVLALGTVLVMTTFTTTAWAGPSVPTGAYITRPVVSGQDLAKHVRMSPVVRQRYEKAWGLSTAETHKRFAGIRLGKMPQTAMLNVYYFRPATGSWGYKLRRVKQGTPVFLRGDGTPVMMKICGNPIAKPAKPVSPQDQAKVPDFTPEESIETLHTDTPPPADPAAFPEEQRIVALEESGAPLSAEPAGPQETTFLTETPEGATDSGGAPTSSSQGKKSGGGFKLPFNLSLDSLTSSLLPGLLGAFTSGGGSTSTATFSAEVGSNTGTSSTTTTLQSEAPGGSRTELVSAQYSGSPLGSTSGGGAVSGGGRGSLSAPEPSLALMVPLLPLALWKTRRRNAVK